MPKRKSRMSITVRPVKRRRYRTKRRVRNRQMNPLRGISNQSGPLRNRLRCIHQYSSYHTANPSAGAIHSYYYSANSLYDPNRTGVGHSAMGFDQLKVLYDHFVVIASKIVVRCVNISAGDAILALRLTDTTGIAYASQSELLEQQNCRDVMMAQDGSRIKVHKLSLACCPQKFLKGSKKNMLEAQFKGGASSDPTEECFYEVSFFGPYGNTPQVQYIHVDITYVAIWMEPKHIAGS